MAFLVYQRVSAQAVLLVPKCLRKGSAKSHLFWQWMGFNCAFLSTSSCTLQPAIKNQLQHTTSKLSTVKLAFPTINLRFSKDPAALAHELQVFQWLQKPSFARRLERRPPRDGQVWPGMATGGRPHNGWFAGCYRCYPAW